MRPSRLTPLAFALLAAACAGDTGPLTASDPGITYRYQPGEEAEVESEAARYCADFDRRAVLDRAASDLGSQVAVYECVE